MYVKVVAFYVTFFRNCADMTALREESAKLASICHHVVEKDVEPANGRDFVGNLEGDLDQVVVYNGDDYCTIVCAVSFGLVGAGDNAKLNPMDRVWRTENKGVTCERSAESACIGF